MLTTSKYVRPRKTVSEVPWQVNRLGVQDDPLAIEAHSQNVVQFDELARLRGSCRNRQSGRQVAAKP